MHLKFLEYQFIWKNLHFDSMLCPEYEATGQFLADSLMKTIINWNQNIGGVFFSLWYYVDSVLP